MNTGAANGPILYVCTQLNTWSASSQYSAGAGIAISGAAIATEDALVPVYYAGSGAPAMDCAAGRDYYVDVVAGALYYCKAAEQWQAVSSIGHTHTAADIATGTLSPGLMPASVVASGQANTYVAGQRQSMSHDGANAGLRLVPAAGDPSSSQDGDLWYNLTTSTFRRRQNGVIRDWDAMTGHNLLSATHGDTVAATVARGDLITGQGTSALWSRLGLGAAGSYLRSNGADLVYAPIAVGDLPSGYPWANLANLPASFTPSAHAGAHLGNGSDPIAAATQTVRGTVTTTTASAQVVSTDDARMTNARAPTAHAASHQNGGADEIATNTPAPNAIPKAGAGGTLAAGWIPTLNQNTTGNAATATALASAPAKCGAGTYPLGIDAGGNAQNCTAAGAGTVTHTTAALAAGQLVTGNGANDLKTGDLTGDCSTSGGTAVTCTKTNGASFAPSATIDTTNAQNLSSGTLPDARLSSNVDLLSGSQTISGNKVFTGKLDASGASHTLPSRAGIAANKPGTCTVGEEYFATDAAPGQNKYYCTATNIWTQQSGGGGGGSVSAGCGVTVNGSTVSWNPADMRNCAGIWEDFLGGSNSSNWGGSIWPWTTVVPTGSWTLGGSNPTTYSASTASHVGTIKISAPNTAAPQVALAPINHYDYVKFYPQVLEWTTAAIFLASDTTYGQWQFGFANNVGNGYAFTDNAGIYMRYMPPTDMHMMGFVCYSGTCNGVDFGSAPAGNSWQSAVIQRQVTGLAAPRITMTWNGTSKTFCASGCDATDSNLPANTLQLYYSMDLGVNGTQSGIYWDIDALALFFQDLGR